jgi:hypothetical protein
MKLVSNKKIYHKANPFLNVSGRYTKEERRPVQASVA